ncbi:RluA family pseudouridine synthase [Vibrio sonorensis]|uniref:RluA family pseudouridine synthase n=1 Tax=Vibrio sonorensis TaxID=1004316 RepID=UPI0008DA253F|nr:RluA family pseudouridine synthase [Vibrio sonorensis]
MANSIPFFTKFESDISGYELPKQFTFPFYYTPHPLCILAANQLQQYLLTQNTWQYDFGLNSDSASASGKMFGVLLVKSPQGEIGYLSAFSGKIGDDNHLPGFVPPVFDILEQDGFFQTELAAITQVNARVKELSADPEYLLVKAKLDQQKNQYQQAEQAQRQIIIKNRASRKAQRQEAQNQLSGEQLTKELDELAKQSVAEKNQLKYLKQEWQALINDTQKRVDSTSNQLEMLKEKRKALSNTLQHKLFAEYQFLNAEGEQKNLNEIFAKLTNPIPPAGSGECAAPKLLQFAYLHGYKPLALAEFWWGRSPKSEVRQHQKFYPSCHSKCHPILGHMLEGLDVEPNPLEQHDAKAHHLEIVYEDEAMVVVNKPAGLLSVPGKTIQDCVYARLQERYPEAEGPIVIHRLDMATSGLLVFALTKRANKSLQKQFISRTVKKTYIALLDGVLQEQEGNVHLPMRGDPDDRPRQLVCFEHGKPAHTYWRVLSKDDTSTRVELFPHTGRTHQLRVHCAHYQGLNTPIIGDGLYGERGQRLHLHAFRLEFDHPYSKQRISFEVKPDF